MFIRRNRAAHRSGMTLIELMFSIGVFSIASAALMSTFNYSMLGFAALSNYSELDSANRQAMDVLTREIRQAQSIDNYSSNSVTLRGGDGVPVTYAYNPTAKTMTRSRNGTTQIMLRDCESLSFNICQRNPIDGTYDIYPVATTMATAKVINLSWKCKRTLFNGQINTENVQTARIVIRK